MSEIRFVDTTLRDGQQSLWAMNMRTGMMLSVAEWLDQAGFEAMEFFVPSIFKKMVRELKENPWEWIRAGTQIVKKTPVRYHGGMGDGMEKTPQSIGRLLIERIVSYGITVTRTSDPWNDFSAFNEEVKKFRQLGMETVVNLIYSVSPKHTEEYYAQKARDAAAIKPYRLCFKDVGGMLTPERTRALVPIILKNVGDVPVEFHVHCNNGLGPLNCLEAIKMGIKIIHTALPPLANGSGQPSIFNVAANARALGYTPIVDEEPLKKVSAHLTYIAKREGLPIGKPLEYDHSQYLHQVPGGMISNLRHQLSLLGMEDKLEAILEEAARVRAEFGYPIMVTPLSQFVGSQAAINVLCGERYKEVTDQVIQYALGLWGKEATEVMDPNVKDKILNRPRAREFSQGEPPEPSIHEIRRKLGGPGVSDEELLLRFFAGPEAVDAMYASGPRREYLTATTPLVTLIQELTKHKDCSQIYIRKGDLKLTLGRKETLGACNETGS